MPALLFLLPVTARFGLVYLRVPTWAPFRAANSTAMAHIAGWRASWSAKGIGYTMADNAFVRRSMTGPARRNWRIPSRPTNCTARWIAMPRSAAQVSDAFGQSYHWSLMQVEYATDLAFRLHHLARPTL